MSDVTRHRPVAMSIAGSDSGGGAGIQADLRSFSRLGVFGTTAITAVTAQNLEGVDDVVGLPASAVEAQVRAVCGGFAVRAVKTGMLWSADTVRAVSALVAEGVLPAPVVDPVMVATSGAPLLEADAVSAYETDLFSRARVITPNLDEAALLLGAPIAAEALDAAARALNARYGCPVLLKGGHAAGDPVDLLCEDGNLRRFENNRVAAVNTHGSGCTLSAAIAARLTLGDALGDACANAIAFLQRGLRAPIELTRGHRLIGIEHA